MNKRCTRCEEYKSFGAFSKHKRMADGLHNWCKECNKAHSRQPRQKLMGMYGDQTYRSKKRGHQPPTYTRDDFTNRYLNDKTYIKLHRAWVDSNYDTALAPSFDRINNDFGYTFDNIELMTWGENHDNKNRDHRAGRLSVGTCKAHVAVNQYTKDGEFIQSFVSQHEASRVTGIRRGGISSCVRGECKSAGGFLWKRK